MGWIREGRWVLTWIRMDTLGCFSCAKDEKLLAYTEETLPVPAFRIGTHKPI